MVKTWANWGTIIVSRYHDCHWGTELLVSLTSNKILSSNNIANTNFRHIYSHKTSVETAVNLSLLSSLPAVRAKNIM